MLQLWKKLTRHQKSVLAGKYGVSCINDMEPTSEQELEKVPQEGWDRFIEQKPKKQPKKKETKKAKTLPKTPRKATKKK